MIASLVAGFALYPPAMDLPIKLILGALLGGVTGFADAALRDKRLTEVFVCLGAAVGGVVGALFWVWLSVPD